MKTSHQLQNKMYRITRPLLLALLVIIAIISIWTPRAGGAGGVQMVVMGIIARRASTQGRVRRYGFVCNGWVGAPPQPPRAWARARARRGGARVGWGAPPPTATTTYRL